MTTLIMTGAIGGSCISYIGPGLVYLRVNGEDWLRMVGSWLDRWWRARGHVTMRGSDDTPDLPAEGGVSLKMAHGDGGAVLYKTIISGSKPVWYRRG
jgi:hypothetical protein